MWTESVGETLTRTTVSEPGIQFSKYINGQIIGRVQ